jgi:hypothetical protein
MVHGLEAIAPIDGGEDIFFNTAIPGEGYQTLSANLSGFEGKFGAVARNVRSTCVSSVINLKLHRFRFNRMYLTSPSSEVCIDRYSWYIVEGS